jgi:diguanylate cyclase (GGDEF)-like protein
MLLLQVLHSADDNRVRANKRPRERGGAVGRGRRRRIGFSVATCVVLSLGVVASAIGAWSWRGAAITDRQQGARGTADQVVANFQTALERDIDLTGAVRALVLSTPHLDNPHFRALFGYIGADASYPDSLGFGYSVLVPASGLAAFAKSAVADPIEPNARWTGVLPPGNRARYCLPSLGVWTFPAAFPSGLDLCATDSGYLGSAAALDTTVAIATASTESALVKSLRAITPSTAGTPASTAAPNPGDDVLILFGPVYKNGVVPVGASARESAITGWTVSIFDATATLKSAAGARRGIATQLALGGSAKSPVVIATAGAMSAGAISDTESLVIPGLDGRWLVTVDVPAVGGLSPGDQALLVLAAALAFNLLLFVLVISLARSRVRALRLVDEKTRDLQRQALHDDLTGLPNRTLVLESASMMLARAKRYGTPASALFVDLDDFKDINDTLGHAVGDEVLQEVSRRLVAASRDVDIVGRLGGDEFIVLIESSQPNVVAARILERLECPIELTSVQGRPLRVSASIGIATSDAGSAEALLADADLALYRAKSSGKRRYVTYEAAMRSGVEHRVELAASLREAIDRDEFFLVYQPIVQLETLEVAGVEALLRWDHPVLGVVPPGDFIPALEETGLILAVGQWVLDQACLQAAEWRRQGLHLSMSVNVSPRQFDDDQFVEAAQRSAERAGLDPGDIILEVTEDGIMRNERKSITFMEQLREIGFRLAIDDFGTGYSSLSRLRKLPFDMLKIDQSFVSLVGSDPTASAIVGAIVDLCNDLGVRIIAEGVEEAHQLDVLRTMGCPEAQGFLFSKPLPAADVLRFATEGGAASALGSAGSAVVELV